MSQEYLVEDTVVTMIELNNDPVGETGSETEIDLVKKALEALCTHKGVFFYESSAYKVVPPRPSVMRGTSYASNPNGGALARIALQHGDQSELQTFLEFKLVEGQSGEKGYLTSTVNPTTLKTGKNILPASFVNADGTDESYPSSSLNALSWKLKLGFDFLQSFFCEECGGDELFSNKTKQSINELDFHVVRFQVAGYLRTKDRNDFLLQLIIAFDQTIVDGRSRYQLADHLGLRFRSWTDRHTHEPTGTLFEKHQGNAKLYSVSAYDKMRRVQDMQQDEMLTEVERGLIETAIRLDVTIHSEGIKRLVAKARDKLVDIVGALQSDADSDEKDQFITGDAKSTAWFLSRAIMILSTYPREGHLQRNSFARWLIPEILEETLHLDVIGCCTRDDFLLFANAPDPLTTAWRAIDHRDAKGWAQQLSKASGKSLTSIYNTRRDWMKRYKVDIALPYPYYHDLHFYGHNSVYSAEDRAAHNNAVKQGSGDDMVRLSQEALNTFEQRRIGALRAAIKSKPVMMLTHDPRYGSAADGPLKASSSSQGVADT